MILGKGQSSWSAALAELLIIALGVLVALGADGWNAGPLAESATYEDLRSSGKLGLIRDPALRVNIINYYSNAEGQDRRITARRTEYPHVAYRIIPQSGELAASQFGGVERVATENRASVVAAVRASERRGFGPGCGSCPCHRGRCPRRERWAGTDRGPPYSCAL